VTLREWYPISEVKLDEVTLRRTKVSVRTKYLTENTTESVDTDGLMLFKDTGISAGEFEKSL
jgi:hypothetical protein